MARRGGRRSETPTVLEDQRLGSEDVDDDVAVLRTREGHAILVPASLRRMPERTRVAVYELQDIGAHLHELQALLADAVQDARAEGASWSVIGWSLGVTGEAARKRWGDA